MDQRQVKLPRVDGSFAYFLGVLLGDGSVGSPSRPIIYLVGHSIDERDYYDKVIIPLITKLFGIKPYSYLRKGKLAYATHFRSRSLVEYLASKIEFPTQGRTKFIPGLIRNSSPEIKRAFIAGLFDSDGCLVLSKKTYRTYCYPTVEIKSINKPVISYVSETLKELGFRASIRKSAESWVSSVNGSEELDRWMSLIGIPKHQALV